MRPLLALFLLLLPCAPALAADSVARGRHFRIVCHFENDDVAKRALEVAEAAWRHAAPLHGVDARQRPAESHVIHLYRDEHDYARAEWPLTGGRFRRSGAFTAAKTRAAYVAIQPHCTDRMLEEFGLPTLTLAQIAHEATHVVAYRAVPNAPNLPLWLAEGSATWVAATVAVESGWALSIERDPFSSRMQVLARKLLEDGRLPSIRTITASNLDTLSFYERYAVWWTWFRYLMEGRRAKEFREYFREAIRIYPVPPPEPRLVGLDDDEGFHAFVEQQRPRWDEEIRSLEVGDDRLLQRAFPHSNAVAWRTEPVGRERYAIRGTLRILPAAQGELEVLLGRAKGGHVAVTFAAGRGVEVSRYDADRARHHELARVETGLCRLDAPLRFEIRVEKEDLTVLLEGRKVARTRVHDAALGGPWGLGARAGSVGVWGALEAPRSAARIAALRKVSDMVLMRRIRKSPQSEESYAAVEALGERGPGGWRALGALVRELARRHPAAAARAARALGRGDEEQRRVILRQCYKQGQEPELRSALLIGLSRWYPQDEGLLHEALHDERLSGREAIFANLIERKLPIAEIRRCLRIKPLAYRAYDELRRLKFKLNADELVHVAREEARQGYSISFAEEIAGRLAEDRGWELVGALARLVNDRDEVIARGAHTLLLTLSGKDMLPDPDVWRSWVAARRGSYLAPAADSPGRIAAAVQRGVDYLRRDLLDDGACGSADGGYTTFGATGLAVLALRASGIPKHDLAIRRAIELTLLEWKQGQLVLKRRGFDTYTYGVSILAMALASVDAKKYLTKIQALAQNLAAGQLPNGQWTYQCRDRYDNSAQPRPFGDNSNTQYALLGLRAAAKAGADVPPETWRRARMFLLEAQDEWGGFGYEHSPFSGREISMTSAGISSLVIAIEGQFGKGAAERIASSRPIHRALVRQGQLLHHYGLTRVDHYTFYGIERACILTGTRKFNDYDWYREGVRDLLARQQDSGAWKDPVPRRGFEYEPPINTAYALLFLKRATTPVAGNVERGRVAFEPGPRRLRDKQPPWVVETHCGVPKEER